MRGMPLQQCVNGRQHVPPPPAAAAAAAAQPCAPAPHCRRAGEKAALDHLGPLIVNADGSLRRIANWAALSEGERVVALRRVSQRNRERLAALEQQQEEQQQPVDERDVAAEEGVAPPPHTPPPPARMPENDATTDPAALSGQEVAALQPSDALLLVLLAASACYAAVRIFRLVRRRLVPSIGREKLA